MRTSELTKILQYFYSQSIFINNEIVEMEHRLIFRNFDEVDYLELIILLTRAKEIQRIEGDILKLLNLNREQQKLL